MAGLRINLLGTFSLRSEAGSETWPDIGKSRELLCYLLLNRDRRLPREALAAVFWGDASTSKSRKYLRQTLWQLQTWLNTSTLRANGLLRIEADWVYLDSGAGLWLDIAVLEQAFLRAQGVPGRCLEHDLAEELRAAAALYHGDLLEGWYQDWCIFEREHFQSAYITILDKLMAHAELHHAYEDGIGYGTQILRHDRARETTHRRLMRLHFLAGDRTAALRQYQRCAAALQEELAVRPTRSTDQLLEQIRADRLPATPPPATGGAEPTLMLQDFVAQLSSLRTVLADLQVQVRNELQSVDVLLSRLSQLSR